MGFRFGKRIRLGKYIHLNISRSGIGFSAGVPGARLSVGPSGTRLTAGIPGTGLSYIKQIGGTKRRGKVAPPTPEAEPETPVTTNQFSIPSPGLFAPAHEKALANGLRAYEEGNIDQALQQLLTASESEAGAAFLAAMMLGQETSDGLLAISLLESVVQSDETFPTPLMDKYLPENAQMTLAVTPHVEASVPMDGLGAALMLAERYQEQERLEEAIGLLEEVEEVAEEPILTLSLCELYAEQGAWEGVIERAAPVVAVDDTTLEIVVLRGRALHERGLHEAAVSVLTEALRKKKDRNPTLLQEAQYWRALSYQALGKKAQANRELQKLYALAPRFRDVAARLFPDGG